VADVGAVYDTQPFQLVEIPVNSRQVDTRCLCANSRRDLAGTVMAGFPKRCQKQAACRTNPAAVPAQDRNSALYYVGAR
jgi:hypothetical protein